MARVDLQAGAPVRRERDPERTRAAILTAATAEFARAGLAGASVNEVAARAGVNKRMLYHYFGSKEGLYLAVLEETYAGIRDAESGLNLESLSPPEAIQRLVTFTFDYFVAHPEFLSLLNTENLHEARHLRQSERVATMHSPLEGTLARILKRGAGDGVLREGIDPVQLYISIASLSFFYLFNRHTLGTIFSRDLGGDAAFAERRAHVADVILAYVRAPAA